MPPDDRDLEDQTEALALGPKAPELFVGCISREAEAYSYDLASGRSLEGVLISGEPVEQQNSLRMLASSPSMILDPNMMALLLYDLPIPGIDHHSASRRLAGPVGFGVTHGGWEVKDSSCSKVPTATLYFPVASTVTIPITFCWNNATANKLIYAHRGEPISVGRVRVCLRLMPPFPLQKPKYAECATLRTFQIDHLPKSRAFFAKVPFENLRLKS
ncbi:hypothetical protein V8F06_008512 [Rhypophila decipiens]